MRRGQAKGAAVEMENLFIDLNGRPVTRKGYITADVSDVDSIGTSDGKNASGDRLYVAHYLGSNVPTDATWSHNDRTWVFNDRVWTLENIEDPPVKRIYYFRDEESWASDPTGRIIYVVRGGRSNYLIDVKENRRYSWNLSPPPYMSVQVERFVHRNTGFGLPFNRNDGEIRAGLREIVNSFSITNNTTSDHADTGIYLKVGLATDVRNIEIYIDEVDEGLLIPQPDDRRATLFRGFLAQGTYAFYWDLHDFDGEPVDPLAGDGDDGHQATVKIEETEGYHRVLSFTPGGEVDDEQLQLPVNIKTKTPEDVPLERFSVGLRQRVVCQTYSNPDLLGIESRPTGLFDLPIYETIDNSLDVDINPTISISTPEDLVLPDWVSHLNVYASDETPDPDFDYSQNAGATGLIFRLNASTDKESRINRFTSGSISLERGEKILDSFDHDEPTRGMHTIAPHGVGLWGADRNTIYFSKIGNQGEQRLYAMPSENALVPHQFDLVGGSQSPVVWIHPASHVTGLLAFKRDAIHVIRGRGVIEGLYNPETPIQVDLDASSVLQGTGTSSPKSVLTVGNGVYFVGSDRRYYRYGLNWRGQAELKDVGLPVQKYLDDLTVPELDNLTAFLYQNCYHLIMPDRVLIMDMSREYWTSASWRLKDAFWSRGGLDSESILYGVTQSDDLIELYEGDTDGGTSIGGTWESNPIPIPSESVLTGVLAVHTTNPPPEITCSVKLDDVDDPSPRPFTPAKYNDFRYGTHKSGSRVSVKLSSDDGFPLLDRIQAELFLVK